MNRPFTGRHMLAVMIAFFGVVIAVNLTMAVLATRTFGGTVVDNSYVASQRFNGWLEEARAQQALGWRVAVDLDANRHATARVASAGGALEGATVSAVARHPVGREADVTLAFAATGDGLYRSLHPLPEGRWNLHLRIRRGTGEMRLIESVQ